MPTQSGNQEGDTASTEAVTHPVVSDIPKDLTCLCTWDDISLEAGTYCEYRIHPTKTWHSSNFSSDILRHLLKTQFGKYLSDVEKASKDCAAAVRRLINKGPPIYIADATALPLYPGEEAEASAGSERVAKEELRHVDCLWFSDTNQEVGAKLEGCMEGEDRLELWNTQKQTLEAMEAVEKGEKV